jgi:hypothetical protein
MPEAATLTAAPFSASAPAFFDPKKAPPPEPGTTIDERLKLIACEKGRPIEWAYWLEKALEATYTGLPKVSLIKDARVARYYHPDHDDKSENHPDRQLTSKEAIRVLEQGVLDGRCSQTTVDKAKTLMREGWFTPPPQTAPHKADSLPPPPEVKAPDRRVPALIETAAKELAGTPTKTVGPVPVANREAPAPQPHHGKTENLPVPPHMLAREALAKAAAKGTPAPAG